MDILVVAAGRYACYQRCHHSCCEVLRILITWPMLACPRNRSQFCHHLLHACLLTQGVLVEVLSLVDGLDGSQFTTDQSMQSYLESRGVSKEGLAFADTRYAQTASLALNTLGVLGTINEVLLAAIRCENVKGLFLLLHSYVLSLCAVAYLLIRRRRYGYDVVRCGSLAPLTCE